jgi:hypothetical protein
MKGRFLKSGAGRSLRGAHLETDFEKNKVMASEWGIPKIRPCQRQSQGVLVSGTPYFKGINGRKALAQNEFYSFTLHDTWRVYSLFVSKT